MKANEIISVIVAVGGLSYGLMERWERIVIAEQGIETTRIIAQAAEASALAVLEESCLSHHEEIP